MYTHHGRVHVRARAEALACDAHVILTPPTFNNCGTRVDTQERVHFSKFLPSGLLPERKSSLFPGKLEARSDAVVVVLVYSRVLEKHF